MEASRGLKPAVDPLLGVTKVTVQFQVTGDKKHQTGISMTLLGIYGSPTYGRGGLPGSDNQNDFWPAGGTHSLDIPITYADPGLPNARAVDLNWSVLQIHSGDPDEWHTLIQVIATFVDGSTMIVRGWTGELGFNWDGQNGQPSHQLILSFGFPPPPGPPIGPPHPVEN